MNKFCSRTQKYIKEKLHNETSSRDRSEFQDFYAPAFLLNQNKSDTWSNRVSIKSHFSIQQCQIMYLLLHQKHFIMKWWKETQGIFFHCRSKLKPIYKAPNIYTHTHPKQAYKFLGGCLQKTTPFNNNKKKN